VNELDPLDRKLLNMAQGEFPLVERPFAEMGRRLGIAEEEVMERLRRLKEAGVIRQLSGVFDSRRLGYRTTLVAMGVPDNLLDEVAATVSRHPGVSHNYRRDHNYNLWFTLAVPPGYDAEEVAQELAQKAGVSHFLSLPAFKMFKVGVIFDLVESWRW